MEAEPRGEQDEEQDTGAVSESRPVPPILVERGKTVTKQWPKQGALCGIRISLSDKEQKGPACLRMRCVEKETASLTAVTLGGKT